MTFSPDGQLMAAAGQGAIRLFGTRSLDPDAAVPVLTGYPAAVTDMSFSLDRRWMAAASGDLVVLSDLQRSHRIGTVAAEPQSVCNACLDKAVAVSPDGRFVAWLDSEGLAGRPRIRLWNLESGKEATGFRPDGAPTVVLFGADSRSIIVANPVGIWDLDGHRLASPPVPPSRGERALAGASSPQGGGLVASTVLEGNERTLVVRDMRDGKTRLSVPSKAIPRVAVSSGGTLAIADNDGSIQLWTDGDASRNRVLRADAAGEATGATRVDALAFDSTGAHLVSLSGGTLTVWDVPRGRPRSVLRWGKRGTVRFSPDGRLLAAAGQDGAITLWDVASLQPLGTVKGHSPAGGVPDVGLTPDGRTMASVVPGGGLMLWDLSTEGWTKAACAVAQRDLSAVEWDRYVGAAFVRRARCQN